LSICRSRRRALRGRRGVRARSRRPGLRESGGGVDVGPGPDLESTCWDGSAPDGQISEIIEVGQYLLDVASLERSEERGILVRPERSEVSPFCTELTTLTPADVASGISFAEACAMLRAEFRAGQRVWASYGEYDAHFPGKAAICPSVPSRSSMKSLQFGDCLAPTPSPRRGPRPGRTPE
jgi:hypothetical protein